MLRGIANTQWVIKCYYSGTGQLLLDTDNLAALEPPQWCQHEHQSSPLTLIFHGTTLASGCLSETGRIRFRRVPELSEFFLPSTSSGASLAGASQPIIRVQTRAHRVHFLQTHQAHLKKLSSGQGSLVYPYPSVSDLAGGNSDHGPSKTRTKTQTTPDSIFTRERRNSARGRRGGSQVSCLFRNRSLKTVFRPFPGFPGKSHPWTNTSLGGNELSGAISP